MPASTRSVHRSLGVRLALPFATALLALFFLGYHCVVVWGSPVAAGHIAHAVTASAGNDSARAIEDAEGGHEAPAQAEYSDCATSNSGCLNAKTELALPAPQPVGGVLLRPAPFPPLPAFAHSPLPQPPSLAELSILRI